MLKLSSFRVALEGIIFLLKTQNHARWHLAITVVVIVAGCLTALSRMEWLALLAAMGLVWTAEALNTALEQACDAITQERNQKIKNAKDVAAGAVLLAAITAIVVGALVFFPRLSALLVP